RTEDAQVLDQNADLMKANPGWLVLIEGHADQRGTPDYNLALSERRARASMNYLVSRGVRADRFSVISYGEERPMCKEASEDCWSQNRRAHFAVKAKYPPPVQEGGGPPPPPSASPSNQHRAPAIDAGPALN